MTDKELQALHAELNERKPLSFYPSMPGHAEAKARCEELRALIRAEEERRAGLEGRQLVERQLEDAAEVVAANQRMADASETAAKASADAARWAKWAAMFTAIAAAITAVGTLVPLVRGK